MNELQIVILPIGEITPSPDNVRKHGQKDLEQIRLIHNLVKVRGFKIAAAREMLTKNRQGVQKKADALQALIELRDDLQVLKGHLEML